MSKRSGGSVTGGTLDVKPQILTFSSTQATVNQYQVLTGNLPVPRFGTQKSKATIFEILKCYFYLGNEDKTDLSAGYFAYLATNDTGRNTGDTCSSANTSEDRGESNVLAYVEWLQQVTTSGGYSRISPTVVDLTDSNGNGVLVATDRLVFITGSLSATAASTFAVKILYRMVNVGVSEYVGIVQSQMQ